MVPSSFCLIVSVCSALHNALICAWVLEHQPGKLLEEKPGLNTMVSIKLLTAQEMLPPAPCDVTGKADTAKNHYFQIKCLSF